GVFGGVIVVIKVDELIGAVMVVNAVVVIRVIEGVSITSSDKGSIIIVSYIFLIFYCWGNLITFYKYSYRIVLSTLT
ncbi:hypothetical protein OFB61_22885, partial [Escherichia coli]|nr:hypothetical protein [Escherichia coli]